MIINSWLSVRDDFVMPAPDPADDTQQQAANREFLNHAHDWNVVGGFYPNEQDTGRTWALWSVYYKTKAEMDAALATLQSNNPGRTRQLGQWDFDSGAQTENQYPQLVRYMPDVGDPPVPATSVFDVNLLAGQSPRVFT